MKPAGKKPNEKNRADPGAEEAAAEFAYERPAYGQLRASDELKKQGIPVSTGGVRGVRLRHDPAAFKGRLRRRRRGKNPCWPKAGLRPLSGRKKQKKPAGRQRQSVRGIWRLRTRITPGHICRQTFIDTYSKASFRKPYGRKNAPVAADTLNDTVIPFFDSHGLPPLWVFKDRGSECCGNREHNEYALYLEVENTGRAGTKAKSPGPTGYANGLTRRAKTSSTRQRSGGRCTGASLKCSLTLTNGCGSIMRSGRTAGNTVMGRRR
jgi:hypothetical protein